jgi:nucleoside-diphosphate-sugar epimerase
MASKPRVLVTGVAGFIGSNLADRLLWEGYAVVGIDNLSYGIREQVPDGVEFHELDIRNADIYPVFEGVDVVFHLAAKNSLLDCQNDPVATMDNNVVGTTNVFEAAKRANVKKVVYAQSSVLEEGDDRLKGFYAISKMADEWVAEGYRAAFGMTTVGLRYFQVYGPRQDYRRTIPPIMSKFIITLLSGKQPILFERDNENRRDFIHVDDVNDFHVRCISDDRVNNRVFRLGSGKNHSLVEILATIQKILDTDLEPILKPRMAGDPPVVTLADIAEARALGWAPKVSLEEGLRSMVPYIKAEMAKGNIK